MGLSDALTGPIALVDFLSTPGAWIRIGKFVLGGALIIGGLYMLAEPTIARSAGTVAKAVV